MSWHDFSRPVTLPSGRDPLATHRVVALDTCRWPNRVAVRLALGANRIRGHEVEAPVLPNAIAIANGKGGVGKTSLSANLAGLAAHNGWQVLLVDIDPQGNLSSDLGYGDDPGYDGGQALLHAVEEGVGVAPLREVRPGLDVVTGGDATDLLEDRVRRQLYGGDTNALYSLYHALAPVAGRYNLIVVDCPPNMGALVDLALSAVSYLVIPTKGDAASLNGLTRAAARFVNTRRTTNPQLALLGVCLFGFGSQDTKLVAKARGQLEEALEGIAPVFETFVRHARKAPDDMREMGLLAHEYLERAQGAPKWYENRDAVQFSTAAAGVASDYQNLATEILGAFAARQNAVTAAA